ncbi:hypothetical protein K7X08_021669 [Anisodus acutangulus]|uniref:SNRNP25 ubiquitin-like domain-containing protein n=1 Tax=Anisodus acutangulus TaxID=402998 RepID=A0A9Q1M6Y3_9SOLA|nr:hypothetical protein K7X08_021669 [Anisodus acutangulus]
MITPIRLQIMRKDRDASMPKTKADEKDLEAKEEQMTLLEMSGDLTTESKQLTAERRKEETNISLEYNSDMKKARLHSTLVALLNDPVLADLKDLKQAVRKRIDDTEQSKMGHRHISWRHVWSKFCLLFHNEKLLDDTSKTSGLRH